MAQRPSSRIRAFLREELASWRAEGIVDERGAETLARRYGLDEPEGAGAVAALYVLASCLVAAGVISLVAWHWEEMPTGVRLALLFGAVVGSHGAGFWMWQGTGRQPRLGHALSFLGTLLFGAAIGLVAQIFHVSGVWYGLFGGWALGALAAGVALPSLPTLGFALLLALFVWGPGFIGDHPDLGELVAWGTGAAALALAFRARSRALFLIACAGLGVGLSVAAGAPGGAGAELAVLATLLFLVAGVLGLSLLREGDGPHCFAGAAGWLGRIAFYGVAYGLSFRWAGEAFRGGSTDWPRGWATCALPVAVAAAALLAAGARRARGPVRIVAATAFGFAVLFTLAVQFVREPPLLAVLANVGVLGVAGARVAEGLRDRQRGPFWEGMAVAAVVAASRFFEIEQGLWLKGAGFIACGVGVLLAGLAFERRRQRPPGEIHHA